jgi:hypothetical protein
MTTVRQLLARHRRGEALSWDEMLKLCPHRVTLCEGGTTDDEADGAVAIIGDHPGAFSDQMRIWTVARLREGDAVMLLAREPGLLQYAVNQIGMDLIEPAGNA